MAETIMTLLMLVLLQAVLGFDNLLYISLESNRAPKEKQKFVRKMGISLAVALRIILLFVLMAVVEKIDKNLFSLTFEGIVEGAFNFHSIIVLAGGVFILFTAVKEILHMMNLEEHEELKNDKASAAKVITMILIMNALFSFDSILSAMALSDDFAVMAIAIIIGGILMIALADRVSDFLQKNRGYEVAGLFILFIVGVMLITEGGHLAHLKLFGNQIHAMPKTTFYFIVTILVLIITVLSRYQEKLRRQKATHYA